MKQSHFILLLICIIFSLGFREFSSLEIVGLLLVISPAELLIIPVSLLTWRKQAESKKQKVFKFPFSKNEWIGLGIATVSLSLFSLIFLGAGVPFPVTLVILTLMTNFMAALYSILFAPITINIHEANMYDDTGTIWSYIFKYIAIVFSGLTWFVHRTLFKMHFLVNKLFALLFVALLIWEAFMIMLYFDL